MMKLYDPLQIGGLVHMILTRIKERQLLLTVDEIATAVEMYAENFDTVLGKVNKIEAKYENKEDALPEADLEIQKILDEFIDASIKFHNTQEAVSN
jgi:Lhr-like helicase